MSEIIYLIIGIFAFIMISAFVVVGVLVFRQIKKEQGEQRYYEEIAREYCINPFWYRSKK